MDVPILKGNVKVIWWVFQTQSFVLYLDVAKFAIDDIDESPAGDSL